MMIPCLSDRSIKGLNIVFSILGAWQALWQHSSSQKFLGMLLSEMFLISFLWHVHSMLGIAPPAPNGILWGVSSHPGHTQEENSTAEPPGTHSKWESVPASPAVWGQEIHSRAVQPGTAHLLALKASSTLLSRQTKQQRHMSRHGRSLHFSQGGCTLVRWLNTSCLMQMCPSSLQRGISWRQLHPVCPVNCWDWPSTDNTGTWHSGSKRELWRGTEQIKHPVLWGKQRLHKGDSH